MTKNSQNNWNSDKNARRTLWFGAAIFLFFAILSAAWFVAAHFIKAEISQRLAENQKINCDDLKIIGFPFRMGVKCGSIEFIEPSPDLSVQAGALTTSTRIYAPKKHIAELQAPAQINLNGQNIYLNWERALASTRLTKQFKPNDIRLEIQSATTSIENTNLPSLSAAKIFAAAITEQDEAKLFISADDAIALGATLPPLNIEIASSLPDAQTLFDAPENWAKQMAAQEKPIQIDEFTIQIGNDENAGTLLAKGVLSLDKTGLLSGKLELAMRNAERGIKDIESSLPSGIAQNTSLILAMTTPSSEDANLRRLPNLTFQKGRIRLGVIPLGTVAPILLPRN